MIGIASAVRPEVQNMLRWLRQDGVHIICLITGDTEIATRNMSRRLEFDDYRAALLPEEKAQYIDTLRSSGKRVVMVGDGVNDALALSKADIGVAMGAGGAEVAIEAADIALVDSNLERLVTLRQLSRQTLRLIEQNYWLAVSTNIAGVMLGFAGWLSPVIGGFLHISHTLGIMLNSNRLRRWQPPEPEFGQSKLCAN
jgi:cation-transporting P-type ATPase C